MTLFDRGDGVLTDAMSAFLIRYGGQTDESALAEALGGHHHLADDIEGSFSSLLLSGDFWTTNWSTSGGAVPANLATADSNVTAGWYFDTSVGSMQLMGDFFLGGDFTLIGGTGKIRTAASGQRVEFDAADLDRVNFYTDFDDSGGNVETEPGYIRGEISSTFGVVDFESALLVLQSPEVNNSGFQSNIVLAADENKADIWLSFDQAGGSVHFGSDTDDVGFISETEWRVGRDAWGGALVVYNADDTNEGGEINLKGPGSDADVHLDNFSGGFRVHDNTDTWLNLTGGILSLLGGKIRMGETTTPTALDSWGDLYFKSDNKLYAQTGDGVEHTVAFV